ncbi:MAG: helix-turn-helix domain-containing protein, partial [Acidobacteriota bacterium]|nr:helix-turn-helix domain-containing protein [Acidobacteriota bacterium]
MRHLPGCGRSRTPLAKAALQAHEWNVSATARELGISRDTLYR